MTDLIERVECKVIISLNDGTDIDISLDTLGSINNLTNYITSISIDESTDTQNNNPVGVVSSNTLKIVLKSEDRSLLPDNTDSPYYGLMDNTATVKVTLISVDGEVVFNTFYVNKWISNITSNNPCQVTIECADLLSIINKNTVPSGAITSDLNTKEAFIYIIDELNNKLSDKYKLQYDESEINFDAFPMIEFDNLEAGNMSTWLNTLSQCTLTNIYIGRDDRIKTHYCLSKDTDGYIGDLTDTVNITQASVDKGNLVNYSNVKINYVTNIINPETELATLKSQVIVPGVNTFDEITLNDKVYKVGSVRLSADSTSVLKLNKIEYGKRKAYLEIENTTEDNITCDIIIYGQILKENVLSISRTNYNSNETLELTNKLILPEDVTSYAENLLSLIDIKASSITVVGFFNPTIKIGDLVYVDVEKSINSKGFYRVVGLQWEITSTIKCTAKLIKPVVQPGVAG